MDILNEALDFFDGVLPEKGDFSDGAPEQEQKVKQIVVTITLRDLHEYANDPQFVGAVPVENRIAHHVRNRLQRAGVPVKTASFGSLIELTDGAYDLYWCEDLDSKAVTYIYPSPHGKKD